MERAARDLDEIVSMLRSLDGFRDSVIDVPTLDLLAHSLQTAALLEAEEAAVPVVVAGLLHDIGHGVAPGRQADHGETGAAFVRPVLGDCVADLIALHIPAKAFLAATDERYRAGLSAGSRASLQMQGGRMAEPDREHFVGRTDCSDALTLRRADDRAKDPRAVVPDLEHWLPALARLAG